MNKEIKKFNTQEFLDKFMEPDPKLKKIIKEDYGRFFMVRVQDLIKLSKLPVPPTRATTHTLIFLTDGIATMKIGFHQVEIRKNECLIVPAGQVFSYEKYEVNAGYISSFDSDFLVGKIGSRDFLSELEFLNIWGNPIIRPNQKTAKYIEQSLHRVYQEYNENGLKNTKIIQSYFIAALCDLNSSYKPLLIGKSKVAIALTNNFKALLHKNIKENHLVTDYARMLNISPNHLNKSIKAVTRKTVSNWIDETLITEAKVLLFQTDNSISEIASALGFDDQSYFSRFFKKYEKITPLAFRKMIEKS